MQYGKQKRFICEILAPRKLFCHCCYLVTPTPVNSLVKLSSVCCTDAHFSFGAYLQQELNSKTPFCSDEYGLHSEPWSLDCLSPAPVAWTQAQSQVLLRPAVSSQHVTYAHHALHCFAKLYFAISYFTGFFLSPYFILNYKTFLCLTTPKKFGL